MSDVAMKVNIMAIIGAGLKSKKAVGALGIGVVQVSKHRFPHK